MTLEDAGLPRAIGWVLAVAGLGGTAASFIIAVEKFRVLADPSYRQNAQRLGETLKAPGGYVKVADVIEAVAAGQ